MLPLKRQPIKAVLTDVTGVLYDFGAREAIPKSVEAVSRLLELESRQQLRLRLVTNQAKDTSANLLAYLHSYGFKGLRQEHLFSPVPAAVSVMKERGLRRPHLLVPRLLLPELLPHFPDVDPDGEQQVMDEDCLLIGDAGPELRYERLNRAFASIVRMPTPVLLSLGGSRFYRWKEQLLLDVGPFVKTLEAATGITAEVIGKPSTAFFAAALADVGVVAEEAVMIGDDVVSDVRAAGAAGITGILVRTGKAAALHLDSLDDPPVIVAGNLSQAVDMILSHNRALEQQDTS